VSDADYYCKYYNEGCHTDVHNWVFHDPGVTLGVNIFIVLALIGVIIYLLWYFLSYRKWPLCVDCLADGKTNRTSQEFGGDPVCYAHWDERDMASEEKYKCPKHGHEFHKDKQGDITIDICPEGCIFLDAGELDRIESAARSSGRTSGQVMGMAIGAAINSGS
jgi:hypothetical protein